jgi:ribose 1,5-bisphosphokinase
MAGRLIAVVGPSGVGKDSVMAGLVAARPGLAAIRRVITRPPGAGGEDCEFVDDATFAARQAAGAFALHWQAHGLRYGIPGAALAPLDQGRDLLVNLSRTVLDHAAALAPGLIVLNITARPETLAARLSARGRETGSEIAGRLAREGAPFPVGVHMITLANDGPLAQTITAARAALYPVSA